MTMTPEQIRALLAAAAAQHLLRIPVQVNGDRVTATELIERFALQEQATAAGWRHTAPHTGWQISRWRAARILLAAALTTPRHIRRRHR